MRPNDEYLENNGRESVIQVLGDEGFVPQNVSNFME